MSDQLTAALRADWHGQPDGDPTAMDLTEGLGSRIEQALAARRRRRLGTLGAVGLLACSLALLPSWGPTPAPDAMVAAQTPAAPAAEPGRGLPTLPRLPSGSAGMGSSLVTAPSTMALPTLPRMPQRQPIAGAPAERTQRDPALPTPITNHLFPNTIEETT